MEAKITALVEQFTTEKLPLAISVSVASDKVRFTYRLRATRVTSARSPSSNN
jgi:hypothetical protein